MPVRERAVEFLMRERVGDQVWHGHTGRCQTMKTSEYVQAQIEADALYVGLVNTINWNRVLLVAISRHARLKHDEGAGICGECVKDALKQLDYASYSYVEDAPDTRPDLERQLAEWKADEEEHGWHEYQDFPKIRKEREQYAKLEREKKDRLDALYNTPTP